MGDTLNQPSPAKILDDAAKPVYSSTDLVATLPAVYGTLFFVRPGRAYNPFEEFQSLSDIIKPTR